MVLGSASAYMTNSQVFTARALYCASSDSPLKHTSLELIRHHKPEQLLLLLVQRKTHTHHTHTHHTHTTHTHTHTTHTHNTHTYNTDTQTHTTHIQHTPHAYTCRAAENGAWGIKTDFSDCMEGAVV